MGGSVVKRDHNPEDNVIRRLRRIAGLSQLKWSFVLRVSGASEVSRMELSRRGPMFVYVKRAVEWCRDNGYGDLVDDALWK